MSSMKAALLKEIASTSTLAPFSWLQSLPSLAARPHQISPHQHSEAAGWSCFYTPSIRKYTIFCWLACRASRHKLSRENEMCACPSRHRSRIHPHVHLPVCLLPTRTLTFGKFRLPSIPTPPFLRSDSFLRNFSTK